MALPDAATVNRALLGLLADGEVHDKDDILSSLAQGLALAPTDLDERHPGGRSKFAVLIDFAKVRLGLKGLIRRVAAGKYQITPIGSEEVSRWGTQPPAEDTETAISVGQPSTDIGDDINEERELRTALRDNLEQLEEGLKFIEEERCVKFGYALGYIDILAQDKSGATVVIELKKGEADHHAVGQVASYMGALFEHGAPVRGLLVAYGFSDRAVAAARVVRDLELHRYGHHFRFERIPRPSDS